MVDSPYAYTEVPVVANQNVVKFILPNNINKTIKKTELSDSELIRFTNYNNDTHETNFGRFYKSESPDPLISQYAYKLEKSSDLVSGDILTISPIQINNTLNSTVNSLSFQLPSNIFDGCITLSEDEGNLIVDLILDVNVIITFNLKMEAFFTDNLLSYNNFYTWCNYSLPYSFNQRKPLLMKNIDNLTSVLSTIDGGLLLMKRFNVNSEFTVSPCTNTSYLNNIKLGFLFNKSSNSPQYLDFNGQSVSITAIIDILVITSDLFITISVNKKLSIWSLKSNNILKEFNLNQYLPESFHSAVLSPSCPNSLLQLSNVLLSIFLSLDNSYIYIFKFNLDDLSIDLLSVLSPPNCTQNWIPIDYCLHSGDEFLKIWVSWVFSESCFYQSCKLYNDSNSTIEWSNTIEANKFNDIQNQAFLTSIEKFNENQTLNKYAMRHVESYYSLKTIKIAIDIFNSHNISENIDAISRITNIEEQLNDLIIHNVTSLDDLKDKWIRFASVCQDIQNRTINKIFAIGVDNSDQYADDPFVVVLKGNNSFTLLKKSTPFEILYFNNTNDDRVSSLKLINNFDDVNTIDLSKLIDLILDYSKGYNESVSFDISYMITESFGKIKNEKDISNLMASIFDKFIIKVANENVVSELLNRLSDIPSAPRLLQYVSTLLDENSMNYRINSSTKFTDLTESLILKSILFNNISAKNIIFGLMLILLTIDVSNPIISIFKQLYESFKYIKLLENVAMLPNKQFVTNYLTKINKGIYVKNNTINMILPTVLNQLCNKTFVYYVISELLDYKDSNIAYEFAKFLPVSAPISKVLEGLISLELGQLEESKNIFMQNYKEITKFSVSLSSQEECALESVKSTVSLIFVDSDVDYFYNLSVLFESRKHYLQALDLAIQASKLLVESKKIETEKEAEVLFKMFELSLILCEYKMSFSAIREMSHKNRIIPLRKFVYKLFQDNKLGYVIEFDYGGDFDQVDGLIFGMGEEAIKSMDKLGDIKLALKYYRVCHSLRLKEGDFRGAIEALYRFNTVVIANYGSIIYSNEENVKILKSNYLVMLNLMKSLKEDDRWVIKKSFDLNSEDKAVDGIELEHEYIKFTDAVANAAKELYLM